MSDYEITIIFRARRELLGETHPKLSLRMRKLKCKNLEDLPKITRSTGIRS